MANSDIPNELNNQFVFELIPLQLIDDPACPERETMDEIALGELALSIGEVGLINPLTVKPQGNRFEIIAGHRRRLGCQIARYSPVPCRVQVDESISSLAMLVHENAYREPVNPMQEARFYMRLLKEICGDDVDVLCQKVRRRREFVEDRLNMLMGNPRIVKALDLDQISMAAGRELNRVKDPLKLLILLDAAIQQGASARSVAEWVRQANMEADIHLPPEDAGKPADAITPATPFYNRECFFCGSSKHGHTLQLLWLHDVCQDIVRDSLNLSAPASPKQS